MGGNFTSLLGLTVGGIEHDQEPDWRRERSSDGIITDEQPKFGFDICADNAWPRSARTTGTARASAIDRR